MVFKISMLFVTLVIMIAVGVRLLRKKIFPYHPLTWSIVEFSWYMISFAAVCIGLIELERIEKLNKYKENEKQLSADYYNKRTLLYAQAWILKIDGARNVGEENGVKWFHKMKGLFEEGMYATRWEGFLNFTKGYVLNEPGFKTDVASKALEYGWPSPHTLKSSDIFLRDEIRWVTDSLYSFKKRKEALEEAKPEENTNYKIRYILIFFFLVGLSLKMIKIYADYKRLQGQLKPKQDR